MSTRLRLLTLLLVACAVALSACGGSSKHVAHRSVLATACPVSHATMGCAVKHDRKLSLTRRVGAAPGGPKFPDVSSFQGHPNWWAAKPVISMAAIKAGEYVEDPDFAWNVATLNSLHIPWAPYWFVRNTGCTHEGQAFIAILRSVGGLTSLPPVLDMEVPEAQGYAVCLANQLHTAFGRWPIIYTAPGTWPGGSNGNLQLWVADYGPSSPPCFWTCHPIAWQYTDGHFGSPTYIPGIGYGDVNLDYGFSKLLPPPPDPHHYLWFDGGRFSSPWGTISERDVVQHYDGARQHVAKYRGYLRFLRAELTFLFKRDAAIATRQKVNGKPSWGLYHRGWRFQELLRRARGQRLV